MRQLMPIPPHTIKVGDIVYSEPIGEWAIPHVVEEVTDTRIWVGGMAWQYFGGQGGAYRPGLREWFNNNWDMLWVTTEKKVCQQALTPESQDGNLSASTETLP